MSFDTKYALLLLPLTLVACSSMPPGPNVMVLPGSGKTIEQFHEDDSFCRQYASAQIGANSDAKTATLETTEANASNTMSHEVQIRYDNAYQQCMHSKGNRIPVMAHSSQTNNPGKPSKSSYAGPPPNTQTPPPAKYIVQEK